MSFAGGSPIQNF